MRVEVSFFDLILCYFYDNFSKIDASEPLGTKALGATGIC